ncbi:MAG TPA: glycosyltransferase, partial [Arenibaculum sp.]|nr:glycosyltransferase [Arenibaculum sp.]
MKVLAVTNMYPRPGKEGWGAFVKSQVESLRAAGIDMDVLVIDGFRSKLEYLKAIPKLRRMCRGNRYDIVHAHYGLSGLAARCQFKVPLVVSYCGDDLYGHSDADGRAALTSLPWVHLHRLLSLVVDGVIVKSRGLNQRLPRPCGEIIPNGIDMSMFRPMDRAACRRELGLDPDAPYVLFPYAPDRPRKNYKLVEAAVGRMNRGRPPEKQEIRILTAHGLRHDLVPLYMNAADVLLLTSFWEGSPNVVKEAMACNMRVVSTDVGDVRELTAGVAGCRICEATVEAVTAATEEVLRDPRPSGGREAVSHLTAERVAER